MTTATRATRTGANPTLPTASLTALGTAVGLVVTERHSLDSARELLEADLAALDQACSRFRSDSQLRALDGVPGPVRVSPLLAEAVAVALRAARLTDGDVDPTGGTEIAALGYDRDFAALPEDGPAVPARLRPFAGWRTVRLDLENRLLTVPAGVVLDLGATAKAFAADRAAAKISARLGCGVLVSLGGDIAVAGPSPAGGWSIRVQDLPEAPGGQKGATMRGRASAGPTSRIAIETGGLATSSTSARRWTRGGRTWHHLLDPRTGLPALTPWRTVSVAAASCTDANIASTAAVIRGPAAPGWLRELGLPARLVDVQGQVTTVGGWPSDAEEAS